MIWLRFMFYGLLSGTTFVCGKLYLEISLHISFRVHYFDYLQALDRRWFFFSKLSTLNFIYFFSFFLFILSVCLCMCIQYFSFLKLSFLILLIPINTSSLLHAPGTLNFWVYTVGLGQAEKKSIFLWNEKTLRETRLAERNYEKSMAGLRLSDPGSWLL